MDIIGYVEKSDEVDRIPWNVIITQLNLLISLTYETRIYDPLQVCLSVLHLYVIRIFQQIAVKIKYITFFAEKNTVSAFVQ